uniref:Integrase, catalytic region, zinc finger, CCHC-type, peptidase aspartic, catalytic n=1 Tax=Tanacetum cinerariifolium TaxID=118510 RepID=A0A6L2N5B4_TANCI|nr:hypothetical protein [Tanacetum cinerariifolium]
MTTLADKAILSGADNRPPMLEKDMYDSWKIRMELYMMNRQHGRMILESVENGPFLWPSIEENKLTQPKKYSELSVTEAIQADCDVKATNIIFQGLPPEVYVLVINHKVAKELWKRIQLLMQGTSSTKQERECKLYDESDKFDYKKGESLHEFYLRFSLLLNEMNIYNMKLKQFQVNKKFLNTLSPEWSKFVIDVKLYGSPYQSSYYGSQNQSSTPLSLTYPPNDFQSSIHHNIYNPSSSIPQVEYALTVNQQSDFSQPYSDTGIAEAQTTQNVITHNASYQADDLDAYDSDCDEIKSAKVALMANLSYYGFDDLVEVHNQDNVTHNVINQAVQEMPLSEQSTIVNQPETEITSDSNIIPYSQYVSESQHIAIQNSNFPAQQDEQILFVIAQLKTQVVNCTEINLENKSVNKTLTAELERYKDQVGILKEGKNVDKISDSCAQSLEINNLKQTLLEHLKEKESLIQTVTLLKNDFQKEESRNIDRELALENISKS